MADNITLDAGSGGATLATDDIGGTHYQIVKLAHGALDSATIVSTASGLPVDIRGSNATVTVDNGGTFVVQENGAALTALEKIDDLVLLEDAVHSSGASGILPLAVRKDAVAAVAADGDYHPLLVSDVGGLWTENVPNKVDSGNSSTATLGIGAVFTGTGIDILTYDTITVTVDASHNSATDGIKLQFSTDNSNWDDVYPFTYTAADGARRFQLPVTAQYFRVVYTNGGTGQSHFRLQTILHYGNTLTTIHRLVDDISPDRSALIVKSAIFAQTAGSGDFKPIQASASGILKVSTSVEDAVHVEDEQHSTGDSGMMLLGVENEDQSALTAGDKDYTPIAVTPEGNVIVKQEATVTVDLAGNNDVTIDASLATLGTTTYSETSTKGMTIGVVRNDALATLAGTDNEIAPLQVDEDGGLWTHPAAGPLGGCKMFTSVDLDESEEDPTAGPTTIYGIYAWNATAAPLWLQMFNTNTVTVGTTAPTNNFLIPANADSDGAGVVLPIPVCGLAYSTALTVAITTGSGTNNGAPGAGDAGIAILYQD